MRYLVALALVACAGEERILFTMPEGTSTAIVLQAGEPRVVTRGSGALELPVAPTSILLYAQTPDALGLELAADGALIVAEPGADPEHVWPLPTPDEGYVFDAEANRFTPAELSPAIDLDAPACGELTIDASARLPIDIEGSYIEGLAVAGETALAVTTSSQAHRSRVFLVVGDIATEIDVGRRLGQIRVFNDGDAYLLVQIERERIRSYRLTTEGTLTLTSTATTAPYEIGVARTARWPGSDTVALADVGRRRVDLLDFARGVWGPSITVPEASVTPSCNAFFYSEQALFMTGPRSGVVSFTGAPLSRFDATLSPLLTPPLGAATPCQTIYARSDDGREQAFALVGALEAGRPDVRVAWRFSAEEEWRRGELPIQIRDVAGGPSYVIAIDRTYSDVVMLTLDERRPERRPRLCSYLGVADGRFVTHHAGRGAVVTQENDLASPTVTRFRVSLQ